MHVNTADRPLDRDEFDTKLGPLGPFEPAPLFAAGVSGGADSLALALLLSEWAKRRGGTCVCLVVDHGLRVESRREARWTADQLTLRGISAHVLTWRGQKPAANRQAAARAARYRLMADWCRRRGVLHLALAHHRDDQAETFVLRLARGSGLEGLAAMAPISPLAELCVLRPLLEVPKSRLVATLCAREQSWLDDPSNRDRAFSRVRWRRLMPSLAAEGLSGQRLAATATHLARARASLEQAVADLTARCLTLHPAGFAWLDLPALVAAQSELALRALARLLTCLGGADYAPRWQRLERLYGRMLAGDFRGATLAGCRLRADRDGRLLVVREPAKIPAVPVVPGERLLWDGRFRLQVPRSAGPEPLTLAALGRDGWQQVKNSRPGAEFRAIPVLARPTLPALWSAGEPIWVPHLGVEPPGSGAGQPRKCRFRPKNALIGTWLTVA